MGVPNNQIKIIRPKGFGVRHVQAILLFLGMMIAFSMRVNMSMAIVDMTDENNNNTHFNWTLRVQSIILSAFFWGYIILQVPAGELARRFGGKVLFITAITVNSLLSLATPIGAVYGGWQLLCACRMLQGLMQALIYPCTHHLVGQWMPFEEKGLLTTIVYAGGQLGIGLQLMASGFLASTWGWQAIFYTNGVLGLVWTVAYIIFGAKSPETSRFIRPQEVLYIQNSLGRVGELKRYPTPWLKILTSLPFWAVIVAHCGQNWGFFTLMTEMPTYMSKVLNVKLQKNGVLSSLPYLSMYLLSFVFGAMSDLITTRKWTSVTNNRKLFNTIGLWGPIIALTVLSYVPAGQMIFAVAMLTVAVGVNAGTYAGYMLVHTDLATNFSANLMGITNFLANICSLIAPLACGFIIQDETEPSEWRKVFFVASGVYFFTNLFFILFSTSEKQSWNEPKNYDIKMTTAEDKATDTTNTK